MSQEQPENVSEDGPMPSTTGEETGTQFAIQRTYVADLSFEAPQGPTVFKDSWEPKLNLDINTNSQAIEGDLHSVVLTLTVTVQNKDTTAFLIEIKQAGIFTITGFPEEELHHTLGSFCPSVLYPYAREVVTNLVSRGGFPQLVLAPINFEALYRKHLEKKAEQDASN